MTPLRPFFILLGLFIFCLSSSAQEKGNDSSQTRTWLDANNRELTAEFLYFEDGLVGLKLANGREAVVGIETLSETDQNYVFENSLIKSVEFQPAKMPEQTQLKIEDMQVQGGPSIFETRWFRFENQELTTKEFVHDAAQVFEATRLAIESLPLGLVTKPPKGLTKFKARFVTRAEFDQFISSTPGLSSPDKIAGIYDPKAKSILVPYDQLGVKKVDGRIALDRTKDRAPSTLVHEITHQLMHDRLPLIPIWLSEGLAEYMASIPYTEGSFDFKHSVSGLKNRLKHRYGSLVVTVPPLEELLNRSQNDWRGHTDEYAASLVYTYYFMHLDQPEAPGSPLAAYLFLLDRATEETHTLIGEYNSEVHTYNQRVVAYNAEILQYRKDVAAYQGAVKRYNQRVDQYNQQVIDEVPAEELIDLGNKPSPPQIPVEPKMSERLESRDFSSPIDLYQIVNFRARPSLLRAREYSAIQADMREKFTKIGITITFDKDENGK